MGTDLVFKSVRSGVSFVRAALVLALFSMPCAAAATTDPARAAVDQLVADYIGLYAGTTLDRWRTLFHPAVVVAFPDDDGTIRTRTLDEFVTRQRNYFA